MTLYDRIRELRIAAGMSQEDLAHAMGYKDRSMITKIESGKVDLSQKKIVSFAQVLNTTPAYLMGWSPVLKEDPQTVVEDSSDLVPVRTDEAKILAKAIDKLPQDDREKALNMIKIMYPNVF